jgi:hypothetical protein
MFETSHQCDRREDKQDLVIVLVTDLLPFAPKLSEENQEMISVEVEEGAPQKPTATTEDSTTFRLCRAQ